MKKIYIIATSALMLLASSNCEAKLPRWVTFWKKPAPVAAAPADTVAKKPKPTPYEKLFKKETSRSEGIVTIHKVGKKLYFEIPLELCGKEFVMGSTIRRISDNGHGVVGAKNPGLFHFTIEQVDSTLYVREINDEVIAAEPAIEEALSKSSIGAISQAFPRKAYNNDSTAVVIDVTDFFLSDNEKKMSPFWDYGMYTRYERNESFKSAFSFITDFNSFDDNLSVTSSLNYSYSLRNPQSGKTVVKDATLTAELTRSIMLLPEKAYHPRMGDPRVNFFVTERNQLGGVVRSTKDVFFANRWNLAPSDTAAYLRGELVEPVKPIVFYIDNDFPELWKPYIHEAVNQWQEPFERIGFKNAIVARDFPTDDPQFNPENIKYSCIRYAPIGIENAMGPSWVDPRSGEIITATVYVYHDIIKLVSRWMYVQTAQADPAIRSGRIPEDHIGDAIRYVITHEVGHCLGLMHNMSASAVIPVESLRDPEFTQANGTTTSIMDYARFNYVAQPGDMEKGVKLTPPRFGTYDYWSIKWGYTPVFGCETMDEEEAITSEWITDSLKANPVYRYGKQQVYSLFFDPSCQNEDLGDDVIAASRYGIENLKYITANFMDWVEDDPEYELRTDLYNGIINQYATYVGHVARNVGGIYRREVKVGDGQQRFQNVPRDKQLACLDYLFELWNDVAWMSDRSVVDRLPIVGTPELSLRRYVQNQIISAPFLCGYSNGISTDELSSTECFRIVESKVFAGTREMRPLTKAERVFQYEWVTSLMQSGNFDLPGRNNNYAISDEENLIQVSGHHSLCSMCEEDHEEGYICYSPVAGYEYVPRNIFNPYGDVTRTTIYTMLIIARDDMKAAMESASDEDKIHYELLTNTINYGLK